MVDTVNILARWALLAEIVLALKQDGFYQFGGWYFQSTRQPDRRTGGTYLKFGGVHKDRGISVRGKDFVIEWVQASLPRVLHGYNGRLITNPFQLVDSQERLFQHLSEIADTTDGIIEFIRVDLVLNLTGDPRRFVMAHRGARHPWVRCADVEYGDTGIRFPGKNFVFQLYSKQKERADRQGFDLPQLTNSIRVEVQLKNKGAVRRVLGWNPEQPVGKLDFFQCYRKFRWAWCLFDKDPISFPAEKCTLHAVLAECEAQGLKTVSGLSFWEWFELTGQRPATLSRVRKAVQRRKQEVMQFRWADMLPLLWGPEPVIDIYPDGREVELRDLW